MLSRESNSSSVTNVEPSTDSLPENPFSNDNAQDTDSVQSTRKINKQKSSSSSEQRTCHDSPQEIAEGNCLVAKGEKSDVKIDTPKKRFFDLKRTAESASNKISSISQSLTPKLRRKSATNHKLSQLERQSNLFIRDGSEAKINKQEDGLTMESGPNVNAKHQQNSPEAARSKKSSLIPSFYFRIPSTSGDKSGTKLCKNFSSEPSSVLIPNQEEIDTVNEDEDADGKRQNMITNAPDVLNDNDRSNCTKPAIIHRAMEKFAPETTDKDEEFNSIESCGEALSKADMFKNIPVRARKGKVAHMENYCLFDPSVDFWNEKELRKSLFPPQNFHNFQKIANKQQSVYDVSEHDERLAHHNYYEIDPELLEQDEAAAAISDHNRIEAHKSDHVSTSSKSSSSSSSCDYPSLFNSVIETTPSSTVTIESTDEHESNAYGRLNGGAEAPKVSSAINQTNVIVDDGNVITISSIVTATGAKKKSPQLDRIVKQSARNSAPSTDTANQQQTTSSMKGKSTEINLPFYNETLSFETLKSSYSLPQLQSISIRQRRVTDGGFNIEINNRTTIQLRRNVRKVRPMSSESLDSGFTTPSPPPNEPPHLTQSHTDDNQVDNLNSDPKEPAKHESTVLTECCDNSVQQLIEVSDD